MGLAEGVLFVVGLGDEAGVEADEGFGGDVGDGLRAEVVDGDSRLSGQISDEAVYGLA